MYLQTGGPFGVKKVTVYTAVVYVDRFLSSMPIQVTNNTPSVSIYSSYFNFFLKKKYCLYHCM